jgi:hypothetical protein
MKTVTTRWMDVAGQRFYPVFDALRAMDPGGQYTFPDEATGAARDDIGSAQQWTVPAGGRTLIGTAGHLHPGGLNTQLKVSRGALTKTLFTSNAHYFEPAGAVSWDVSMGATPGAFWRVKVQAGDKLSLHTTYDTKRADWYEGMGIMPIAVYNGTDVGGLDALANGIPQNEVLTHGHLRENDNHGGAPTAAQDPLRLPGVPVVSDKVDIKGYAYLPDLGELDGGFSHSPATILSGQTLSFKNFDAEPSKNAFHTITNCAPPCNGTTGIAYPVADGPVSFDSGQLGFNAVAGFGAPAADRDTWELPKNIDPGTYTYFCRIHPFMRGSFRVSDSVICHGKKATLVGTEGPDVIRGTKGRDVILGLGGNDKLIGLGAKDTICGGVGKDKLMGGPGRDRLFGDAGKDRLIGGQGVDKVVGGPGLDKVIGGSGQDRKKQ